MKSLAAFTAAAVTAIISASCGYSPLYQGPNGANGATARAANFVSVGAVDMTQTSIDIGQRRVAGKTSQRLKLEFPLPAGPTLDTLSLTIEESTSALAVQRTATVARAQITLTGYLKLVAPDGTQRFATTISSAASYNVEDTPFSTESGKTFAQSTAAGNLAEEAIRRVVLYYKTVPPKPEANTPKAK